MKLPTIKRTPMSEFLQLPEVFCQRDTEYRANKSKDRLRVTRPEHLVVSTAKLTCNSSYHGVNYEAGETFCLDGNTRKWIWTHEQVDDLPEEVLVLEYEFDNCEDIVKSYWTFDSVDATEGSGDKFYGILKSHKYLPCTTKIKRGNLMVALQFAYTAHHPGSKLSTKKNQDLKLMTKEFLEEIKYFDSHICTKNKAWDQALVTLALLVLRKYPEGHPERARAIEGLKRIDYNDYICGYNKKLDGIDILLSDWNRKPDLRDWCDKTGTQWANFTPQIDFVTKCFDKWMTDNTLAYRGWRTGYLEFLES